MSIVEVAVLGYGLAGSVFHAPLIAAQPRMRVAAVVTSSAERAERARAEHPGVRVVPRAEELFAAPDGIDLVVIATPNHTHAPLARQALEAGLPVVVDKPFAVTADDADDLVRRAERSGLALSVFQNRRWDGDFRTVRELVETGKLGHVRRFESRFERWRPVPKGGWREVGTDEEGAGILLDLGSHLVDQAVTLSDSSWGTVDPERWGVLGAEPDFTPVPTAPGAYPEFYSAMTAALLDGGPVPVDPRDAVTTLRLLTKARESAARGVTVTA
ncbi:Gfo/Idh/MocA family oxidoreductase [Nocardia beijingensis]|uniref:Gfo/Idh/MocA family oxidoreductase n=1 Tax=Nocardia beijingensis TaxID=95162 RepID=UPI00344F4F1E